MGSREIYTINEECPECIPGIFLSRVIWVFQIMRP